MNKVFSLIICLSFFLSLVSSGFCPAGSTTYALISAQTLQPLKVTDVRAVSVPIGSSIQTFTISEVVLDTSSDPSQWHSWCYSNNAIWQISNSESFQNDQTGLFLTAFSDNNANTYQYTSVDAENLVYDFTTLPSLTGGVQVGIPFSITRHYGEWIYAVTASQGGLILSMGKFNQEAPSLYQQFMFKVNPFSSSSSTNGPSPINTASGNANILNWGVGLPLECTAGANPVGISTSSWPLWTVSQAGIVKSVETGLCLSVSETLGNVNVITTSDCSTATFNIVPWINIALNGYVEFRYLASTGIEYALQAGNYFTQYYVSMLPVLADTDVSKPYQKWNIHYV